LSVSDPVSFVGYNKSFVCCSVRMAVSFMFIFEYFCYWRCKEHLIIMCNFCPYLRTGVVGEEMFCKQRSLEVKTGRCKFLCSLSHEGTVVIICSACFNIIKVGFCSHFVFTRSLPKVLQNRAIIYLNSINTLFHVMVTPLCVVWGENCLIECGCASGLEGGLSPTCRL
jgi:hypothetical protein